MPTSLRLNGDRNRAALWWGEAKRVLFQLKENLGHLGIEHGWRTRQCVDGTIIRVGKIYGSDIIMITSPFLGGAEEKFEMGLYIICVRNIDFEQNNSFKIYSIRIQDDVIKIKETEKTPAQFGFHLEDSDTGTAPGIISKISDASKRKDHVVSYGLNYTDWLFTYRTAGFYWNENITYEDRYLYTHPYPDPYYGTIFQIGYRMVNAFKITGGRSSYFSTPAYFPKLVAWTLLEHNSYAAGSDVVGKNNITLNAEKTRAESWGERICEQENAPYTFSLDDGLGTVITDPFQNIDVPYINWVGRYSWPIIGTLNARKVPKIYSMKYEDDVGTQTTEDYWTETLAYDETAGNGTGSGVTYWPIAAIGNKKFLYIKNTLTQDCTSSHTEDVTYSHAPGPEWYGEPAWTITDDDTYDEEVTQEFYAGTVLIESLISTVAKVYDRDAVITPTGDFPIGTYSETITETFEATYRWVEVLDYSNLDGNLIVIYKKITEIVSWPLSESEVGPYAISPPYRIVNNSRVGTSTRKVEYYMATIIDEVFTKRLLETFDGTCNTERSSVGTYDASMQTYDLVHTATSQEDGTGKRIYGVSCQMNKDYSVFSFNKETFAGTGASASDYFKAKASVKKMSDWFGDGVANTHPLPYPSPLEDMNNIIETTTPIWSTGKFCVGAIGITKKTGEFGYSEFDNQTDKVAATGLLDILRRIE